MPRPSHWLIAFTTATVVVAFSAAREPVRGEDARSGEVVIEHCSMRRHTLRDGGGPEGRAGLKRSPPEHWTKWWYSSRVALLEGTWRAERMVPVAKDAPPASDVWRDEIRTVLHEALGSKNERVAAQAAVALGRGGDARDATALALVVADARRDGHVRAHATLALGLLPPGDGKPEDDAATVALASVLSDGGKGNDEILARCYAAWALGLRKDKSAYPALSKLAAAGLDDPRPSKLPPEITPAVLVAMGLTGNPAFEPELIAALAPAKGGDARAREVAASHAAQGLALLGVPAIEALREAARDKREDVRRAALLALGAIATGKDEDTLALLVASMKDDSDLAARTCAAIALGRIGGPSAGAALLAIEDDAPATMRTHVHLAMGLVARASGDAAVRARLLERLKKANGTDERGALCIANALAGTSEAHAILLDIASGKGDAVLRSHAAYALGVAEVREAVPVLRALVEQDESDILRYEASLALGRLADAEIAGVLQGIVARGKGDGNRATAAVCLGRIGGEGAAVALLAAYRDEKDGSSIRPCFARALGMLLDRTEGRTLGRILAHRNWWLATEASDEIILNVD